MTNSSLKKIVRYGIAKKVPIKKFKALYEELDSSSRITEEDYISDFLTIDSEKLTYYKEYQIKLVINISSSIEELLEKFWSNIFKLNEECQLIYLTRWNRFICSTVQLSANILNTLINRCLINYTLKVIEISKNSQQLLTNQLAIMNYLVFFWGSVFDNFQNNLDVEVFKKTCSALISELNKNKEYKLVNYLISKTKNIISSSEFEVEINPGNHTLVSSGLSQKNFLISSTKSRKYGNIMELKKQIWIHDKIQNWKVHDNKLLDKFVKAFYPQNNTVTNIVVPSFLASLLCGFASSIQLKKPQYILFNYKNYILSKFPHIVLESKFNNNFENSILKSFELLDEKVTKILCDIKMGSRSFDIRKLLIKNCICNELIPIQSYFTFFPTENINQQGLIHEVNQYKITTDIEVQFKEKLLDINSEFTSLEESGLLEFMDSLPRVLEFLRKSQETFHSLILTTINDFIAEKQNEKLSRLILALLHNLDVLYYLSFSVESGPHFLLGKLMQYLDSESFDADEADNLQDLYSYFGIILLGILSIIEIYNIDYSKFLIKFSYSIDYINNFYYRLCDNFTNNHPKEISDDEKTIIANYSDLINDWINALFDENTDGLSDDLIKSVNVKQAYKMVSIIYQQAIIATNSQKIDRKLLNNGIDYLTQPLLAPCMMSLINWLLQKIDTFEKDLESIYIKVLCDLINSNLNNDKSQDLNDESNLIFKIILNSKGNSIIETLTRIPDWKSSLSIVDVIDKISKKIGINHNDVENGMSLKLDDSDLSLNDLIKERILDMIKENKHSYQSICKLIEVDRLSFLEYLLQEVILYYRNNNEDIKIFIDIAVYINMIDTVNSMEEKNYWINELSTGFKENGPNSIQQEKSFNISMESHFSSIFNFNSSQRNGDESDDLFNDTSESLLSSSFRTLQSKAKRYTNLIHDLIRARQYLEHNSEMVRAYYILKEKITSDLHSFSV